MPTDKEAMAMTTVLWDEDKTTHPWKLDALNTMGEQMREIKKRIELVGPIPCLVFNSDLFDEAVKECLSGSAEAA